MKPLVIAFAGPIASGKTTIALNIAAKLEWTYTSFGAYLRKEARKRGLDSSSRHVLQEIGNSIIAQGWERFCLDVLADGKWTPGTGLIIDGIRHGKGLETIKTLVKPLDTCLIYIHIDNVLRQTRLSAKNIIDIKELTCIENHPTERQVKDTLRVLADFEINGSLQVENIVNEIFLWLTSNAATK